MTNSGKIIKFFKVITCVALSLALPAQAGVANGSLPEPSDAQVAVPAVRYQSPLGGYLDNADDQLAPDKNWRAANDAVGAQQGMAGMDMSNTDQYSHGGKP